MRAISILFLILLGSCLSSAAPSAWSQRIFWQELQAVLVHRCQSYTPDSDFSCFYATQAMIDELRKDISPTSIRNLSQAGVAFKPEVIEVLSSPHIEYLLDFWQQQLKMASVLRDSSFSLFDKTAEFVGSEEEALRLFAVLLQDISLSRGNLLAWVGAQESKIPKTVLEKWSRVLELIADSPKERTIIFYPSSLWASSQFAFNKAFYHFYVPAYLYSKIRTQKRVVPEYAATAVFLFNYMYENFQENGAIKAFLFEPNQMRAERNLNDIRLAYLGPIWVENKHNLPALYAQNAFLKLPSSKLKQSLSLWIERLHRQY